MDDGALLERTQEAALVLETYVLVRQDRDALQSTVVLGQRSFVRVALPLDQPRASVDRLVRLLALRGQEGSSCHPVVVDGHRVVVGAGRLHRVQRLAHIDRFERLGGPEVRRGELFLSIGFGAEDHLWDKHLLLDLRLELLLGGRGHQPVTLVAAVRRLAVRNAADRISHLYLVFLQDHDRLVEVLQLYLLLGEHGFLRLRLRG